MQCNVNIHLSHAHGVYIHFVKAKIKIRIIIITANTMPRTQKMCINEINIELKLKTIK